LTGILPYFLTLVNEPLLDWSQGDRSVWLLHLQPKLLVAL